VHSFRALPKYLRDHMVAVIEAASLHRVDALYDKKLLKSDKRGQTTTPREIESDSAGDDGMRRRGVSAEGIAEELRHIRASIENAESHLVKTFYAALEANAASAGSPNREHDRQVSSVPPTEPPKGKLAP